MTTRRNGVVDFTIRPMTAQNPTPNADCPMGSSCPTCTPANTFFVSPPPAAQRGLAWTDGQINVPNPERIDASKIYAPTITGGTLRIAYTKPAPELTVKQAGKAYKKAKAAREDADKAAREARMAATRAEKALENAHREVVKAQAALEAAALR